MVEGQQPASQPMAYKYAAVRNLAHHNIMFLLLASASSPVTLLFQECDQPDTDVLPPQARSDDTAVNQRKAVENQNTHMLPNATAA